METFTPSPTKEDWKGESVPACLPTPTTLLAETPCPRLPPCQGTQGDQGDAAAAPCGAPSDDASTPA